MNHPLRSIVLASLGMLFAGLLSSAFAEDEVKMAPAVVEGAPVILAVLPLSEAPALAEFPAASTSPVVAAGPAVPGKASAAAEANWKKQLASLKAHFPDGLVDADGAAIDYETLKGKAVGIYFSAAWCGPCRMFSPLLFKHRDTYSDSFQVVFVSSDRSPAAMTSYMKKNNMNCPAVKFGSSTKTTLSRKYGVRGIPKLVLLDGKGELFSGDGRKLIMQKFDMKKVVSGKTRSATLPVVAKQAPGAPKQEKILSRTSTADLDTPEGNWEKQLSSLKAHFPAGLVDADGKTIDYETLKGKVVGIYFSAAWCGPCRVFSPVLFKHRDKYKDSFEVVFISSDRTADAMKSYMKKNKMNCPAVPFGSLAKRTLSIKYGVRGIPKLVLLDQKGGLFSGDGRKYIMEKLDMDKVAAGKIRIEIEEYLCGKCEKIHTRPKVVGLNE